MKPIAWVALVLGVASVILSVYIVSESPRALEQLKNREFPLTGLGEGVIAMLLPILLSIISCLLGVFTLRRRLGQVAFGIGVCSWLVLWKILDTAGFHYLF